MARGEKIKSSKKEVSYVSKLNKLKNFDYTLLFIIVFILAFGLVMLYSTSAYAATLKMGDSTYYLKRQIIAAMLGFCGMAFTTFVDYRFWRKHVSEIYIASVILCVAVIFVGVTINNSSRWLNLGPVQFQPSELAKIAVILYMAALISRAPKAQKDIKYSMMLLLPVMPIFLVVAYNNLSTAIIILGIGFAMVFISSPHVMPFVGTGILGCGLVFVYISLESYRAGRIDAWLHPENYTTGTGFQTLQGLYAIGSGGLFGKGLGESMQKYIVPEAQNDMIFSIICEELGIFGAVCLILMYILLLYRLLYIANHAKDMFGSFICIGIMVHIAIQVILNLAVVTNTIPNTGVTLPLISYGGTSVTVLLTEFGLALSVSKNMEFERDELDV